MSWGEVKKINSDLSTPLDKKIEEIKNQRQASLTGEGTTVFTQNVPGGSSLSMNRPFIIAKFIAPIPGIYKVVSSADYVQHWVFKTAISSGSISTKHYTSRDIYCVSGGISPYYIYSLTSVGTSFNCTLGEFGYGTTMESAWNSHIVANDGLFSNIILLSRDLRTGKAVFFYCEAGEPVVLFLGRPDTSDNRATIYDSTITVTYQNN